MPTQRIKGQETSVLILLDGRLLNRIDTISSCEIEFDLELLEEGYLGEPSNRFDSIFNGCGINISGHMADQQPIQLADAIVQRAQRREGSAARVDISTTLRFPGGQLVSVLFPDVFFEAIPFDVGGREEYVEFSLSGKTSEYQLRT